MRRGIPKRPLRLVVDQLETRCLLTAPEIIGNAGQIILSQFQPYGFTSTVGTQFHGVRLRGPLKIAVSSPSTNPSQPTLTQIVNSGLVSKSQFNGDGFHTVGLQFGRVRLGGGLTVSGSDNEDSGLPPTTPILPFLSNRGLISKSQFNDGGFGTLELSSNGVPVSRRARRSPVAQYVRTRAGGRRR